MSTNEVLTLVFAVLTAFFMLGAGISKITGQPAMREGADHFSIPWERYRLIGFVEVAGAAGAIVGIWVHWLGFAAGMGVTALMLGAIAYHVRFKDPVKAIVPALLALVTSGGYTVVQTVAIWG